MNSLGSASGSSTSTGLKSVSVQSSNSGSTGTSLDVSVKGGAGDSKTSVNKGIVEGSVDLNFIKL